MKKQDPNTQHPNAQHLDQCCGSASIIMRIRIQDTKNVHMDPDPKGVKTKVEKLHKKFVYKILQNDIKKH